MVTVNFSAGVIFAFGAGMGFIGGIVALAVTAVVVNKKKK